MYTGFSTGSATVLLVAELADDRTVVGSAELQQLFPLRCSHVGVLSLGVHPDFQQRGIGRELLRAIIEHARESGLVRLELYVRQDNLPARKLYEDLGFQHEGTRARFVRLADGSMVDDWIMVRFLDPF